MDFQDSVTTLRGVGPKKAEALENLNINTLEDLCMLFPREYEDRRSLTPIAELRGGDTVTIIARVDRIVRQFMPGRRGGVLRVYVSDGTGSCGVLFFHASYLARSLKEGQEYAFYGKVSDGRYGLQLIHPSFSPAEDRETGILPVYPLTRGITQRNMREWQRAVRPLMRQWKEYLPDDFLKENRLCGAAAALENIHFPQDGNTFRAAKYRLIFDELFLLQTGLAAVRRKTAVQKGVAFTEEKAEEEYIASLPYPLTGAQRRCVKEIMGDLESEKAMNRLIQGDVGSGKTAVAEIAMFKAVRSGYQAALMAPTEILARQHYEGIAPAFAKFGIKTGFLSGSLKSAERREILESLKEGGTDVLIGTHAVIQPDVVFRDLGLVITDEQHRFGVDQRIRLREKGSSANVLVMTATPIPRTLAVVVYGDLDISVIDEMPPGRKPVKTRCVSGKKRMECYGFLEKEMAAGRQCYVVTPLIDMSETLTEIRSAQETKDELAQLFDGRHGHGAFRVELLHGGMKQAEKDAVMEAFAAGEIDLLVSTVVIEVGINVPNASVMVIENAERFGLAQMHQLRGRVGRGGYQSWCFLIMEGGSEISQKRGRIMEASADGFYIAEEDLKLRGPGDLFGTRQHGLPQLKLADPVRHADVLKHARDAAAEVISGDPELSLPGHEALRERLRHMFRDGSGLEL